MMLKFRMTLPIQMIVLAVATIAILSLSVSIIVPSFAQNLLNNKNADSLNNTQSASAQKMTLSAKGPIAWMQTDKNGTWIIWGNWELVNNASTPFSFNATFTKVKPDNTDDIKYKIYNYKLASSSIKTQGSSSNMIFNGTGTIKLKGDEFPQVPINIGIIDKAPVTASIDAGTSAAHPSWIPEGGTISILIGDKAFNNLPIYGAVKKAKSS